MSKHTSVTQSQAHFANAVHADVPRSRFPYNFSKKTTFNCSDIVPLTCIEVIPGDTFDLDISFISRLATPLFPTMDSLFLDFYAFFVANRIVWDGWEELMGENKTGAWTPVTPPALVPMFTGGTTSHLTIPAKSIGDYYDLPVGLVLADYNVSSLVFRGYGLIFNEWFRNQNLQAPLIISKGNVQNTVTTGNENVYYSPTRSLLKANKKPDYFTRCLPAPQKGESALIPIELNELIPVIAGNTHTPGGQMTFDLSGKALDSNTRLNLSLDDSTAGGRLLGTTRPTALQPGEPGYGSADIMYPRPNNLWADGRSVKLSASTISELRTAFQVQKLFERDARGGTRYVEMLKAHFGVEAQDYRLQIPEFLGHFESFVGMQSVPQTSQTVSGATPQGNLAAYSQTIGRNQKIVKKSFVEHGFIHIFAVARHRQTYQQGLDKSMTRRERLDFYMPVLSHISEQPVKTKEIYALGSKSVGETVFGYQEPWADYRYKPNRVTAGFRISSGNTLNGWTYTTDFPSRPYLSAEWIVDNSSVNVARTVAVSERIFDQIIMDIAFTGTASRPMPLHGIPGLVDHF
jgi:hypothetical protein